jgi:AI-2 transport protein TqsA
MDTLVRGGSTISGFVIIIGMVMIFNVLKELQAIFVPLVMALFLFFAFRPLNRRLQDLGVPVAVTTLLNLLLVVAAFGVVVHLVASSFATFAVEWPRYAAVLDQFVASIARRWTGANDPGVSLASVVAKIDVGLFAGSLFSGTFSLAGNVVFVLFFYLFVATGHQTILAKLRRGGRRQEAGGPAERAARLDRSIDRITEEITAYVVTKSLINVATGSVSAAILAVMGVEFPIVWGASVCLFNYVPTLGALVAVVLPSAMALAQSGSPWFAVATAAAILVVQTIAFSLIEPKVLGDRLGLNPLVILLALLLWGYVWGLVGMLLSVPLTAVLRIILSGSESENLRFAGDLLGN